MRTKLSILGLISCCLCTASDLQQRVAVLNTQVQELEACRTQLPAQCNEYSMSMAILYWHPKTDFTELGSDELRQGNAHVKSNGAHSPYVDFNWEYGFRLGLGYHFTRGWDLLTNYTRFVTSDTASVNPGALRRELSNFGKSQSSDPVVSVKNSHKIGYQTVNVELGNACSFGTNIQLLPSFGLKSTWINQLPHIVNQAEGGDTGNIAQHVYISEKTTSLGPLTKIEGQFHLCNGWSVFGEGSFALLFTRYRGNMNIQGEAGDSSLYWSNKERKHYTTPNIALALGVEYQHLFSSKNNLVISLGYESQFYLNQSYLMQTRRVQFPSVPQGAWYARNLTLYGLTGSASYEF